jgi:hypothetical protein
MTWKTKGKRNINGQTFSVVECLECLIERLLKKEEVSGVGYGQSSIKAYHELLFSNFILSFVSEWSFRNIVSQSFLLST